MLEVKFADVNRQVENQLGINILSLPGAKNIGVISTQQFAPPQLVSQNGGANSQIGLSDLLNIFIFRPDINFAATIKALEAHNALEILAEPNLMTRDGQPARWSNPAGCARAELHVGANPTRSRAPRPHPQRLVCPRRAMV